MMQMNTTRGIITINDDNSIEIPDSIRDSMRRQQEENQKGENNAES